eukprot:1140624-Pelagomonas_calceolata.AAC.5
MRGRVALFGKDAYRQCKREEHKGGKMREEIGVAEHERACCAFWRGCLQTMQKGGLSGQNTRGHAERTARSPSGMDERKA